MFTDLVDSTALLTRLGEDRFHRVRTAHDDAVRRAIEGSDGEVVKHGGDGLMAVFTAASAAVAAAVAAQRAVARIDMDREIGTLQMRVGISAGDVRVEDGDYFGAPVVEASRLCGVAAPGEILVAEVVRVLAGTHGDLSFVPRDAVTLKGIPEPVAIAAVDWSSSDASVGIPLPMSLAIAQPVSFVGRAGDLEALRTAWVSVVAGDARVVMLGGEPGIGKTRLATQLATEVHGQGATVLFGRCDEGHGVPYQPFAEAVSQVVHALPDGALTARLGDERSALAALVPGGGSVVGTVPRSPTTGDAERQRLFGASATLLQSLARDAPVLLVVDDLHWATDTTVSLLRYLVRANRGHRIMVLGTYRDTELDRRHPLAEALGELRREPDVERITVRGLDVPGVEQLVVSMSAGGEVRDAHALAETLARETGGNPFFASEILRHLDESGADSTDVSTRPLPEAVREVVGWRLARLSEAANDVLRIASVVGLAFDVDILREVCGSQLECTVDEVLDALDVAQGAGVVRLESPRRFAFSHAIVRHVLLDELSATRRARVHAALVPLLERRAGDDPARLSVVAYHALEGALALDVGRVVDLALRAGEAGVDRGATGETRALVAQLRDLLRDEPGREAEILRARVLVLEALCCVRTYDAPRARQLAIEALDAVRAIGGAPEVTGEAAIVLAMSLDPIVPDPVVIRVVDQLLDHEPDAPREVRGQLLMLRTTSRAFGLVPGDPIATAHEAAELALDQGAGETLARVRPWIAFAHLGSHDVDAMEAALARDDADRDEDDATTVAMRTYMDGFVALRRGRLGDFRDARARLGRIADHVGLTVFRAQVAQWEVTDALFSGRYRDAFDRLDRPVELAPEGLGFMVGREMQRVWLHVAQGSDVDARDVSELLVSFRPGYAPLAIVRSWVALEAGDLDVVAQTLTPEVVEGVLGLDAEWSRPAALFHLGELALGLEDRTLAHAVYDQLAPFDGLMVLFACTHLVGAAGSVLGALEALLGNVEDGRERLVRARALEHEMGASPLVARTDARLASLPHR